MADGTFLITTVPQELGAEVKLKAGIQSDDAAIPVAAIDNGTGTSDFATRGFVAALFQAQSPKPAVRGVESPADLSNFVYDGTAKTLTSVPDVNINTAEFGGITDWAVGDRILVRFAASGTPRQRSGPYVVTDLGVDGDSPIVLTRAQDFNESADIAPGSFFEVTDGTEAGTVYYLATEGPFTLDTTELVFNKNTGSGAPTQGDGITVSGTTVSVRLEADKGLELSGGGALQVKTSATGAVVADADGVHASVDDATVEINGSNQLAIKAGGVDSPQMANGSVDLVHLAAEVTDRMIDDLDDPAEVSLTDATPTVIGAFNIPLAGGAVQKRFSAKITVSARHDATAADCFSQVGDGAFRRASSGNPAPIDDSNVVYKLPSHKAASFAAASWTLVPTSDSSGDVNVVWTGIGAAHHAKCRVELIELI